MRVTPDFYNTRRVFVRLGRSVGRLGLVRVRVEVLDQALAPRLDRLRLAAVFDREISPHVREILLLKESETDRDPCETLKEGRDRRGDSRARPTAAKRSLASEASSELEPSSDEPDAPTGLAISSSRSCERRLSRFDENATLLERVFRKSAARGRVCVCVTGAARTRPVLLLERGGRAAARQEPSGLQDGLARRAMRLRVEAAPNESPTTRECGFGAKKINFQSASLSLSLSKSEGKALWPTAGKAAASSVRRGGAAHKVVVPTIRRVVVARTLAIVRPAQGPRDHSHNPKEHGEPIVFSPPSLSLSLFLSLSLSQEKHASCLFVLFSRLERCVAQQVIFTSQPSRSLHLFRQGASVGTAPRSSQEREEKNAASRTARSSQTARSSFFVSVFSPPPRRPSFWRDGQCVDLTCSSEDEQQLFSQIERDRVVGASLETMSCDLRVVCCSSGLMGGCSAVREATRQTLVVGRSC